MIFNKHLTFQLSVGILCALSGGLSAQAAISFNYGSLANGSSNAQIQSLMNSQLTGSSSVAITGAIASNSYTGDGHVVGPCPWGHCSSVTLANSDGTFIMNDNSRGYSEIDMTFHNLSIYNVSFDYEIFPDGTCSNGTHGCGSNWPDLTFKADGTTYMDAQAIMPGQNGTSTHSPNSGSNGTELAPQLLGSWSGAVGGSTGVTTLQFIDWPATIAIDNLQITTAPPISPTPEPASIVLLGGIAAVLGWKLRKRATETSIVSAA